MERQHDYIIKIVMVGSSAVGKTAILKRFADNQFNQFYISTIGVDFRFKSVTIDSNYIKLQIWDTAGQERFKGITKSYYNNADVVIIVYDINDNKSFDQIKNLWLNEVRTYCRKNIKIYVLCNKCDNKQQTMKPSHIKFLNQNDVQYFMVSAKLGKGVQESMMKITKDMIKIVPRAQERILSLQLRQNHFEGINAKKMKQSKCCLSG